MGRLGIRRLGRQLSMAPAYGDQGYQPAGFGGPIGDWVRDHWAPAPEPLPGEGGPFRHTGRPGVPPLLQIPAVPDDRPGTSPLIRKLAAYGGSLRNARQTLRAGRRGELAFSEELSPTFPTAGGPLGVVRRGSDVVGEFRTRGGLAGGNAYDRLQRINARGLSRASPAEDDWRQYRRER